MTPFLRTLPPAGNEIPISLILGSLRKGRADTSGFLSEYLENAHTLFLSSGRAALWLIMKALSSIDPERKKVIIPAYTCPAVISAVLKAGLQPVLCDINLDNFGYSEEHLEGLIDEDILAVTVVHLFGFPANTTSITPICKKNGTFVIEDAAQAFGNEDPTTNSKLGLIGDAGFFSFGRGKPISALHGGLTVTRSDVIYNKTLDIYNGIDRARVSDDMKYLAQLCCYNTFSNPSLYWIPQSIPFLHLGETIFERDFPVSRGSDIASGIAETLMGNLENDKKIRMAKTECYNENLPGEIRDNKSAHGTFPYLRYPLVVNNKNCRDTLLKKLSSIGISGALFYPHPLNKLPGLKNILRDNTVYHNAQHLSERLVTLPVHSGVTEQDMLNIKHVVESIAS